MIAVQSLDREVVEGSPGRVGRRRRRSADEASTHAAPERTTGRTRGSDAPTPRRRPQDGADAPPPRPRGPARAGLHDRRRPRCSSRSRQPRTLARPCRRVTPVPPAAPVAPAAPVTAVAGDHGVAPLVALAPHPGRRRRRHPARGRPAPRRWSRFAATPQRMAQDAQRRARDAVRNGRMARDTGRAGSAPRPTRRRSTRSSPR